MLVGCKSSARSLLLSLPTSNTGLRVGVGVGLGLEYPVYRLI